MQSCESDALKSCGKCLAASNQAKKSLRRLFKFPGFTYHSATIKAWLKSPSFVQSIAWGGTDMDAERERFEGFFRSVYRERYRLERTYLGYQDPFVNAL